MLNIRQSKGETTTYFRMRGKGEKGGGALEEACDDIKNNLDARGCCMRERRVRGEEIKYADMKYCHVQYRQRQEDVLHRRHSRERQAGGRKRARRRRRVRKRGVRRKRVRRSSMRRKRVRRRSVRRKRVR